MNTTPQNMEEILAGQISGFHQYRLTEQPRPCYVSRNLCRMLGFSEQELLCGEEDAYALRVHPADREAYADFLRKLREKEQMLTVQYRLLKSSGDMLVVSDTMTSRYGEDGTMVGSSVLADITELKSENQNLRFLSETIPFGFVKYTCEKTPRVTYINDRMLQILRFPQGDTAGFDCLEMYRQNIFMMVPMEERSRLARNLDRVYEQGTPLAGEMTALRCDGSKAYLFGWLTKCVNEQGVEEFQSACMDITERYYQKQEKENNRYLQALADVYDKIFEFDLSRYTVKCLYGRNSPMFRWAENVAIQMEDATEKWIMATVQEDDRERVRTFFRDFRERRLCVPDAQPPRITYRALSSKGKMRTYSGIFLKIDANVSLFCCRHISQEQETDQLRTENAALKNMQKLVMRFTEGVVAFEVENDLVKPMYTSDNVCSFFGYTKEQWLSLAEARVSVEEFISRSGIAYADIQKLFAVGEAEFTYFDMTQNAYRRIKAICSRKYPDDSSRLYVMLYNVDPKEEQTTETLSEKKVYIRTFGYFDVFVDDKPIAFRNEKSKELFALLTDRRGGFVSSEEAISFLWEDEPANPVTLARYRKVALRLKNILEEYGIADIVESVNGKRRLATDRVRCDLMDYLSGQEEFSQLFKGSYLTNYSWGENTLAELTGEHLYL